MRRSSYARDSIVSQSQPNILYYINFMMTRAHEWHIVGELCRVFFTSSTFFSKFGLQYFRLVILVEILGVGVIKMEKNIVQT